MLIAQITDMHVRPHGRTAYGHVDTNTMLAAAVALGFVAWRLCELDEWGMRKEMSRRLPAQHEKAEPYRPEPGRGVAAPCLYALRHPAGCVAQGCQREAC